MRARAITVLILLLGSVGLNGQARQPPAAARQPDAAASMPVRRVVLYKTGVGYFEHLGNVRDSQDITVRFTSAQLNDVLKTLTAIDMGKGQITSISYNSAAPLEQRLSALRLPVDQQTSMMQLLMSLRGARVEVGSGATMVAGRLLSVEQHPHRRDGQIVNVQVFSIVTDAGEMRSFELSPSVRVRLAERDLRQEVGRYLDVLGSTREQDVRRMVISTTGTGERQLFVSYISEVPIWKSSYRLVVPKSGRPLLQGWAIVDNTIGEDWRNVELSLVAGAPQSFIQQISQPFYGQRPVVPLPRNVSMEPQTHGATLVRGGASIGGTVRDTAGGVIPGVTIRLIGGQGEIARTISDQDGEFEVAAPAGSYTLRAELDGFKTWAMPALDLTGDGVEIDIVMSIGTVTEMVTVTADTVRRVGSGMGTGIAGGVAGGLPSAAATPPPPPAPREDALEAYERVRQSQAAASAQELGDLFEYRIKEPVSLLKNQSALVPIVSAEITAERVSLWNKPQGSGRPLRALWLTNTTGLTLDGGSMTIIEGEAFGGEGLIEPLKPSERRLVSYAADLGVLVNATSRPMPQRVSRVRVREGLLIHDTEQRSTTTYEIRNEGTTSVTLVIEHPVRPGWKLADGQKPAESTPGAERFRVVVDAGKESMLALTELSVGTTRVSLGNVNEQTTAQLVASGVSADDLQRELRPLFEKQSQIAAVDRRLHALNAERQRIVEDQLRLRENMKALRGSSEEKQLLQRYTRQLDEQESRLAALHEETVKATAERAKLAAELSQLIGTMTFEWAPKGE